MNYSLTDKDIDNCVNGKTNIILYSNLKNIDRIDEILYPYDNCVILHEQFSRVGHWAVLTLNRNKNELEYFNSYGDYPDDFLEVVRDDMRKELGGDKPYLSLLMLKSPYNLAYNQYKLQKLGNDIATCGRYVCLRILLADMPLDDFVKLFKSAKYTPDEIAYKLTDNLF